jgi:4-hydroxy-2-oxoheptanedioate aldolase
MKPNPLRTLWREGRAAINGRLAVPSSFPAGTMAHQSWVGSQALPVAMRAAS